MSSVFLDSFLLLVCLGLVCVCFLIFNFVGYLRKKTRWWNSYKVRVEEDQLELEDISLETRRWEWRPQATEEKCGTLGL